MIKRRTSQAAVYRNRIYAGILIEVSSQLYTFRYDDDYFADTSKPAISLTLPKTQQEYHSPYLFPFFFNMLSEGANRKLQSIHLRIDEEDHFSTLLTTAQVDTIGAVTVKPFKSES